MKFSFKDKYIEICLAITFVISIFTFSFIISSTYNWYKFVDEKNRFNDKFIQINIGQDSSIEQNIQLLKERDINNVMTPNLSDIISDNEKYYINNVSGIETGVDLSKIGNIKGRSITKDEIEAGKKVAIIGENLKKHVNKLDNKEYITVFDEQFEVVGIMEDCTFLASNTFIPIKALQTYKKIGVGGNILLVEKEKEKEINLINDIQIEVNGLRQENIYDYIKKRVPKIKDNILMLLATIVNLIIFSILYSKYIKSDLAIMRLVGATPIDILKYIAKKVGKVYIISIPIGLIISTMNIYVANIFTNQGFYQVDIINASISVAITFLIFIAVLLIVLIGVLKFNIVEDVR